MIVNRIVAFVLITAAAPFILKAQTNTFIGKIVESNSSNGIPYVSVGIKGKPLGTIADSVGQFQLYLDPSVIDKSDTVIFTHIGYNAVKKLPAELKANGTVLRVFVYLVTCSN